MGQLERRGHPTQRLASSSPSNLYATSHFQKPPFAATDGCVSNCINCITQNCTFFTRVAEDVNRLSLCLWCSSLHLVTCHHPSASSLSSSVAQNTLFIWNKMSTRRSPLSGACVWMLSKRCYFWKSAWSILESPAIQGEGGQAWAGMLIKSWVFRISCCCFFFSHVLFFHQLSYHLPPFTCRFLYLFTSLAVCLFVCFSDCLTVGLSDCLSDCLSLSLFLSEILLKPSNY